MLVGIEKTVNQTWGAVQTLQTEGCHVGATNKARISRIEKILLKAIIIIAALTGASVGLPELFRMLAKQ